MGTRLIKFHSKIDDQVIVSHQFIYFQKTFLFNRAAKIGKQSGACMITINQNKTGKKRASFKLIITKAADTH